MDKQLKPLQGLSAWLRNEAARHGISICRDDEHVQAHIATLQAWAREVDAALASDAAGAPLPVAWRYQTPTGWHATTDSAAATRVANHHEVQPLYVAPAAVAPNVDGVAIELWKAADACGFDQFRDLVRAVLAAAPTTVAADAAAPSGGMERAFSSDAMCRRDEVALFNRHAETPRLLALLGLPLIDSISLYDVRVRLEHALDASEGKLDEEAHVAQRMTETLAEVYATIIGDDAQPEDDALNAIERVKRAAQVLRLEVDLYRTQRGEAAAQPGERAAFEALWHKARNAWLAASRHGTQEEADAAAIAVLARASQGAKQ